MTTHDESVLQDSGEQSGSFTEENAPTTEEIAKLIQARKAVVESASGLDPHPKTPKVPKEPIVRTNIESYDTQWEPPQPIVSQASEREPYPVEVLPKILKEAVLEVHGYTQSPIPLIANSAIVSMATAAQAHFDIARDEVLKGPISIYALTIAESGERKTSSDRYFSDPLRDYESQEFARLEPRLIQYKADLASWNSKREGIEGALKGAAKKTDAQDEIRRLQKSLHELHKDAPIGPRIPKIVRTDDTPENLAFALVKDYPSAGVISSEGGQVLGSRAFSREFSTVTLAGYNAYWDGSPWYIGRKTGESFNVRGVRLSLGIQVQPEVMDSFKEENYARGIGFLARCLITYPESTQGTRKYKSPPRLMSKLAAFNNEVKKLLAVEPAIERNELKPATIRLSVESSRIWIDFHDRIESQLLANGKYAAIRDIASKIADNAARLAAQFSVFRGFPILSVAQQDMESGCILAAWYLDEALRYFGSRTPLEFILQTNAKRFEKWAFEKCKKSGTNILSRTECLQNLPKDLAKSDVLVSIVTFLATKNRCRFIDGGRNIEFNPALLCAEVQ